MKTKYIFSVIVIALLCVGKVNSQIASSIQKTTLTTKDNAVLEQHLSEFTAFTMDKREIANTLRINGAGQFRLRIDEQMDWTIDLQLNDMRAPDFRQTYISDEGKFEYESFRVNTFKGTTSDGQIARFTIDENNFFGVIFDDKFHYVIRYAKDYTENNSDKSLIVYRSSDIISDDEHFDYINDALEIPSDIVQQDAMIISNDAISSYTPCTYYLKIATDADYEFYQAMGNNLTNTYSYIFSVLNIVEGVYESTFNMKFIVTYQNVWTVTSSGYPYSETNPYLLLDDFRDYWNINMTGIPRNIAHLFTGKFFVGGILGLARVQGLGTDYAYGLSRFHPQILYILTHEIGHNLGAGDNPSAPDCHCFSNINPRSVMCQGGNSLSSLWFCQQSINSVSPFLASNSAILTGNLPNNLTLTGTVSGFNEYQATQKITSNQVVNSGYTVYKAGEIELSSGFEVQLGAEFEIIIDDGCP